VHGKGVEPLCLSAAEPKSAASACFATRAVSSWVNRRAILTVRFSFRQLGEQGRRAKVAGAGSLCRTLRITRYHALGDLTEPDWLTHSFC
jgi:hypothetical protein